jgi:hypothetical protein
MATSTDGHILKKTSTPIDRLITENYNPDPLDNWDLVNVGFLNLVLALFQNGVDADFAVILAKIAEAFDSMGVKMIRQNVALTGLNVFPNIPSYVPKNKERVLLIAQTNPTENGFYEWQTDGVPPSGNLIRIWDWRDVINGSGITINANNLSIKLLEYLALPTPPLPQIPPRNDNFLQFDSQGKMFARIASNATGLKLNANRELYIDGAELGGAGGGASLLDVPHPDIDSVTGATVLLVGTSGTINVNGGNFRRDNTLVSDGFTVTSYVNRKHNINSALVQATNSIGIHNILSKHLTLDSENTGNRTFTVLGSAIINTVTPRAKRNTTTVITVTGVGFALLSQFTSNNGGITISLLNVIDRFSVLINVAVTNAVNSGNYDLRCTNAFGGNTFTSGASGFNKLQIFGDPRITNIVRSFGSQLPAEIFLGENITIRVEGFDLTNEASVNPSGITVNSISGTTTVKNVNITGSSNKADIGIKNLVITDTPNSSDSGTSGNGKMALNYAYSNAVFRKPTTFRAFGGAILSNWVITQNANDVTIERIGGSGMAFLEITDLFLVASLLDFSLGWLTTRVDFVVETLSTALDNVHGCYVCVAPIGSNLTSPQSGVDYWANICQSNQAPNFYAIANIGNSFQNATGLPNAEIDISRNGVVGQNTRFIITNNGNSISGNTFTTNYTSHANKAVFIAMQANYRMRLSLKGWIGD